MDDYYAILGVLRNAKQDDIRRAYRELALKWHPDKNQGSKAAEEKFKKVSEAYNVLVDDVQRKKYDEFLEKVKAWEAAQQHVTPKPQHQPQTDASKSSQKQTDDFWKVFEQVFTKPIKPKKPKKQPKSVIEKFFEQLLKPKKRRKR